MERYRDSGLSLDDLKQMPAEKIVNLIYPKDNLRHKNIPLPDFARHSKDELVLQTAFSNLETFMIRSYSRHRHVNREEKQRLKIMFAFWRPEKIRYP